MAFPAVYAMPLQFNKKIEINEIDFTNTIYLSDIWDLARQDNR